MEWNILLLMLCREYRDAPRWTKHVSKDYLQKGGNKKRFQYCLLNSDGFTHCWMTCNDTKERKQTALFTAVKLEIDSQVHDYQTT